MATCTLAKLHAAHVEKTEGFRQRRRFCHMTPFSPVSVCVRVRARAYIFLYGVKGVNAADVSACDEE
jgi:hypothetical protein